MFKVFIHSTSFTLLLKVRYRIARGNGEMYVRLSVCLSVIKLKFSLRLKN